MSRRIVKPKKTPELPEREKILAAIHDGVAKSILAQVSNPETCTPQVLAAAIRFLSDNGIDAQSLKGGTLSKLAVEVASLPYEAEEDEGRPEVVIIKDAAFTEVAPGGLPFLGNSK